jgi:hypothetical protein
LGDELGWQLVVEIIRTHGAGPTRSEG